jgi:uncharacterized damage-inducible protein DinB
MSAPTAVMSEIARISDQLRRAYEGPAFHGDAIAEILDGVTVEIASAKPLHGIHSIWEIVLHMSVWLDVVRRRLSSPTLVIPTAEENFRAVEHVSAEAWERAKGELDDNYRLLLRAIGELPETKLGLQVPGREYDYYTLLHGIVQHSLYHAGQIALLKKAESFGD